MIFFITILLLALGAVFSSNRKLSYWLGFAGSLGAFIIACYGLNGTWFIGQLSIATNIQLKLGIDHLSAIFLLMASLSWMALSLYSIEYSQFHPQKRIAVGFHLSLIGMLLILSAQDGITLLSGWEMMTIFAFLMMLSDEKHFKRAYRFLAFGELSTVSLLLGMAALFYYQGNLSFDNIRSGNYFVLIALSLGFIIKMDIVPFHGWMRNIYGEIPDNTAALLSAPVTLMGVYGLERIVPMFPEFNGWYLALILLGAFSAFWGSLQAVAANRLKLLPAYSTIENNGMILTAIGFYALSQGFPQDNLHYLSSFAQVASIILALSHTLSKTLLFLSIGHAKEAYNVHTIDEARGVWSGVGYMPAMGILVSALSFSAFPPLIGYTGEWMILETLFQSYRFPNIAMSFFTALSGVFIALAIGLIGFAMIKLIGYTALGYDHERKSRPMSNRLMHTTEGFLLLVIVLCGIGLPFVVMLIGYPELLTGLLGIPAPLVLASGNPVFGVISPTIIAVIMFVLLIIPVWIFARKRKKVRKVNSWNGGLKLEESEYFTAVAYSQILEHILRGFYRTREIVSNQQRKLTVEDVFVRPITFLTKLIGRIGEGEARIIMNGKISIYVTYILFLFIITFMIGMIFS